MSKKLSLVNTSASSLKEVWECFIISKTSKCVSDATLSNYHHHLRAIAKHLDIEMPLDELSNTHTTLVGIRPALRTAVPAYRQSSRCSCRCGG